MERKITNFKEFLQSKIPNYSEVIEESPILSCHRNLFVSFV